ncbi:alpha/beta fold hydrolase [soil metagenome]
MKTISLARANATIAYHDRGVGPPILFIHAFPLDSGMWKEQMDGLAAKHRVIAPDLPGFGGSSVIANWTVDSAADLLTEFLDTLGVTEQVTVAGLSMGGYIAMALARRHAARLGKLILADTKAEPDDDTAKTGRATMIQLAGEKGSEAVIRAMLPKMLSANTAAMQPRICEAVRAMAERQRVAGVVAALQALRDRPDARPGLKAIAMPTLVIVGEHDAITPLANAKTTADAAPGATLAVLPGAGHLSNLESPKAFGQAVMTFLKRE